MIVRLLALLFLSLLALSVPISRAQAEENWAQFRGPGGTGISKAKGVPTTWSEKDNVVWKTPIPHQGWSSPVVWGKQIWLTSAQEDGKAQFAYCVDRDTGKIVHDIKVFETPKVPYFFIKGYNSHASCTPAIEEGRVYVHFGSAGTACIDTNNGKVLWKRNDLKCDHWRAPGSSPVLYKDFVLLTFDGHDRQYVCALNKKDGKTVWETARKIDYKTQDGDLKKGYSTPSILMVDGKPQMISPTAVATVAYNPDNGEELWKVYHGGMNAASPPVMGHGLVFVTIGSGGRMVAIDPTGKGDVSKTHVKYEYRKEAPSRPAPLLLGELIFLVSDKGVASCVEAKTGKTVWTHRITGNYSSSPVFVDGHIYAFDQDKGKGFVFTADREGKLVATNELDAGCRATPAPVGNSLFVRTLTHLYRIEKKQ